MTNPIVSVAVSIESAPAPSTLQRTGAFVSAGGTNTAPGTKSLLTQLSDLTNILSAPAALSSLAYNTGVVTATTAAAHGLPIGQTVNLTIAGASPAGYNGTFACLVTGTSTFTYNLASNPGSETSPGTWVSAEANSLQQRANTFFAQGSACSVYVLEVGPSDATHGANYLQAWITANPNFFYSYLVPRFWDGNATFLAVLAEYESTTAKTNFFITSTLATYQLYTALMKCAFVLIENPVMAAYPANALTAISASGTTVTATTTTPHGLSPGDWFQISGCLPAAYNGWFQALVGTVNETIVYTASSAPGAETQLGTLVANTYASAGIPSTEFSCAAPFRVTLNYKPSSTNKVTQLNQAYVFGVTPFQTQGQNALVTTLGNANVNVIGTGASGGISTAVVQGGNMMDGNPFKYWYSIDWVQINLALALNAVIINGANNPLNPVDYNQSGINQLGTAAITTMATGIADGLVLNPISQSTLDAADYALALDGGTFDGYTNVNADPFVSYTTENPDDYESGTYNGISVVYTPLRGFESVQVNVAVSNFASG